MQILPSVGCKLTGISRHLEHLIEVVWCRQPKANTLHGAEYFSQKHAAR